MHPKSSRYLAPLIAALALSFPLCAMALSSDKNQNFTVSSGEATVNSKQNTTILSGPVKITQGTLEINADKVTLRYDDKRNLKSMLAEGEPARFQQQLEVNKPLVKAEANSINYEVSKDHLTLEKNAFVEQNGATTRGGRIEYDMASGSAHAVGEGSNSGKVELVIPPQVTEKAKEKDSTEKDKKE